MINASSWLKLMCRTLMERREGLNWLDSDMSVMQIEDLARAYDEYQDEGPHEYTSLIEAATLFKQATGRKMQV